MFEHRFRSGDAIDKIMVDENKMEYLYNDGDNYFFMDIETYEQTALNRDVLGDAVDYLTAESAGDGGVFRRQAGGRGSAADGGADSSGGRAGIEVGYRIVGDEAGDDRDRIDGAGSAVRQPRRQDSRGYRGRHLSFPRIKVEWSARVKSDWIFHGGGEHGFHSALPPIRGFRAACRAWAFAGLWSARHG